MDYISDHYCPAYGKIISSDLCYESLCCLSGEFKISSVKELSDIKDVKKHEKYAKNAYSVVTQRAVWLIGMEALIKIVI